MNKNDLLNIEYTRLDKLLHPFLWLWVNAKDQLTQLRYRCQRFKRGYSDYDAYEIRDWFIRTAKPMLQEMRAKTRNHPQEISEEQWQAILLELTELLEIMNIRDDSAARKLAGLAPDYRSTEVYQKISDEVARAKKRFFFLFDLWFFDLWY